MRVEDLGTVPYRQAWAMQERAHEEVLAGGEERVLLVEHPPVITFGRRPGVEQNVVATPDVLAARGVDVVPSDRGGDVTLHAPGQLVAYPIIRLNDHRFSVGGYVQALEAAVISALRELGVEAQQDRCAVGVWADNSEGTPAKLCAIGVRVRRGVTLHGLALNVTTDLSLFDLIIPCGLVGRPVTSLQRLLGPDVPPMERVKRVLSDHLADTLLEGASPKNYSFPRNRCSTPADSR